MEFGAYLLDNVLFKFFQDCAFEIYIYILNNCFFSGSVDYSKNSKVNIFQRASWFQVPRKKQTMKGFVFQKNEHYLCCLGDQNY